MKIGTICSRDVCVSRRGASLASAVERMSKRHVGAIVVPSGPRAVMRRRPISPRQGDALIVIDVQNDFMPGGALGIPLARLIIAPLNRYIHEFEAHGLPIFATRDWHPANHCSFRAQGGAWPPHCVRDTQGAGFARDLYLPAAVRVVSKGTETDKEAYSGFQGTDLAAQLRQLRCVRVFVGGLATDYCVAATALDARVAGFDVVVLEDAIRGVDLEPGDSQNALERMAAAGIKLATLAGQAS